MRDPDLTARGQDQCHRLASEFPYHASTSLLVSSPLRRTIRTALIGFAPEIERGLRIIALPEAQETSDLSCDVGSEPELLEQEFEPSKVDLDLVQKGWNSKTGKWANSKTALKARAKEVRQWLKARPEEQIVLVTHGGFLHFITEDWTGKDKHPGWCTPHKCGACY